VWRAISGPAWSAAPRGAPEEHRRHLVHLDQPLERLPFADEVFLSDEFLERRGRVRSASGECAGEGWWSACVSKRSMEDQAAAERWYGLSGCGRRDRPFRPRGPCRISRVPPFRSSSGRHRAPGIPAAIVLPPPPPPGFSAPARPSGPGAAPAATTPRCRKERTGPAECRGKAQHQAAVREQALQRQPEVEPSVKLAIEITVTHPKNVRLNPRTRKGRMPRGMVQKQIRLARSPPHPAEGR